MDTCDASRQEGSVPYDAPPHSEDAVSDTPTKSSEKIPELTSFTNVSAHFNDCIISDATTPNTSPVKKPYSAAVSEAIETAVGDVIGEEDDDYEEDDDEDDDDENRDRNFEIGENESDEDDENDGDNDGDEEADYAAAHETVSHGGFHTDDTLTASELNGADYESSQQQSDLEIELYTDTQKKVYYVLRNDNFVYSAKALQARCTDQSEIPNEYYMHYIGLDRRLDEWVLKNRIATDPNRFTGHRMAELANHNPKDMTGVAAPAGLLGKKITRHQKRRHDEINHVPKSLDLIEEKTEKEHQSLTKIKYIDKLQIGRYEINTWYFSPFPGEYGKVRTLYVCEYCLKYMKHPLTYSHHSSICTKRSPPGNIIYREGMLAVYEVDGKDHQLYCQLICLLAKLFLDHKTLFYDVEGFMFYILCEIDQHGAHIVGYFSKEKASDYNNVACILVLPPHQRRGFGKLLISLSYELSRREGMIGSPEKPLSDLGKRSYRSYWSYTLLHIMSHCDSEQLTIKELSKLSGYERQDILDTCQSMNLVKYWKSQQVICVTKANIKLLLRKFEQASKLQLFVDPSLLKWAPKRLVVPPQHR